MHVLLRASIVGMGILVPLSWLMTYSSCATTSGTSGSPVDTSSENETQGDEASWLERHYPKPDTLELTEVVTGAGHACALDAQKEVHCWNAFLTSDEGQASPPDGTFIDIAAGTSYSCGISEAQRIECWGRTPSEYIRETRLAPRQLAPEPARLGPPSGRFQKIDAHAWSVCAISVGGEPTCWGGPLGELFIMPMKPHLTHISVGRNHACGITESKNVECWGDVDLGQTQSPQGTYGSIDVTFSHSWAVTTSGHIRCWGIWQWMGSNDPCSYPEGSYEDVSAGIFHACGIHEDGHVECWGPGQKGHGDVPHGRVISIDVSGYGNCAILESGRPYCWGGPWREPSASSHERNSVDPRNSRKFTNPNSLHAN